MKQEAKLALEAAVRSTVLEFPEKTGNVVNGENLKYLKLVLSRLN
jgi:hypothetical protein